MIPPVEAVAIMGALLSAAWFHQLEAQFTSDYLLKELTLGDRTLSQLLPEMRQLGWELLNTLLKTLWLQRLLESTRALLARADIEGR